MFARAVKGCVHISNFQKQQIVKQQHHHIPIAFFSTLMKHQAPFKKFHFDLPVDGKYDLIEHKNPDAEDGEVQYTFDKSQFVVKIPLVAVCFPNPRNISLFCKKYRNDTFNCERLANIVKLSNDIDDNVNNSSISSSTGDVQKQKKQIVKGVLLKEEITDIDQVEKLVEPQTWEFFVENQCTFKKYEYILDYDFWKVDEILCRVLPPGLNNADSIPSSYTSTGHIAHVNLRADYKPYGGVIGQVILDKNQPKVEIVVDKLDSINTKFRTFDMKILASSTGNKKNNKEEKHSDTTTTTTTFDTPSIFEVVHRESNCSFKFDFSKVYWNSRLHTEHDRLIEQVFQKGELVGDVFAGVGPFSVPAGKKQVIVLSNDLNPHSYRYMKENILLNKVQKFVEPLNLDGGEFIKNSMFLLNSFISKHSNGEIPIVHKNKKNKKNSNKKNVQETDKEKEEEKEEEEEEEVKVEKMKIPTFFHHFVMNLPDSSITFMHNFIGIYSKVGSIDKNALPGNFQLPYVHLHCFEKYSPEEASTITDEEIHSRVHARILKELNLDSTDQDTGLLPLKALKFHLVRKVAPTKPMFCVSFQLPFEVVFHEE